MNQLYLIVLIYALKKNVVISLYTDIQFLFRKINVLRKYLILVLKLVFITYK